MADNAAPNANGQPAPGGEGGAPPPAGTPAPGGAPAGAPPPAANARPANGQQPRNGGGTNITIPSGEFKKRVAREAAATLQRELGLSIDEAKAIIAARGAAPAAGSAPAGGAPNADVIAMQARLDRLEKDNVRLKDRVQIKKKAVKRARDRAADKILEQKLRFDAAAAGIDEENVEFALSLFARAVGAAEEGKEPKPRSFFDGLKAKQPFLFKGYVAGAPAPAPAPAPVALRPTTAPPESSLPGGTPPNPNPAGVPPVAPNAEAMSEQDFKRHTRSAYGYTLGT